MRCRPGPGAGRGAILDKAFAVLRGGEQGSGQVLRSVSGAASRLAWVGAGVVFAGVGAMLPQADAQTVVFVTGTGQSLYSPEALLGGAYSSDPQVTVDYPASLGPFSGPLDPSFGNSVAIGASNLESLVRSTPGPLIIVGFSQGALVAQHAAADLNDEPSVAPDTTFFLVANPTLGVFSNSYGGYIPFFDYTPRPVAETRFNTIAVVNEYDAWADPIAQPDNALAVLNSIMAMAYVHPVAHFSDLSDVPPQNITSTVNSQGGTYDLYLVPAKQLPLTMPLRQAGVPDEVVDELDANLRPAIDAAYARNRTQPSATVATVAAVAAVGETQPQRISGAPKGQRENASLARRVSGVRPAGGVSPSERRGSSSRPSAADTSVQRSPVR